MITLVPATAHPAESGADAATAKDALRAWALERRRAEPTPAASADEWTAILRSPALASKSNPPCLAAYLALPGEVSATPALHAAAALGWRCAVPAWNAALRRYDFCRWTPDTAVGPGRFRVPEPVAPEWIDPRELDAMLVPGLAFDRAGNRLGFGRGFYDRLIARCRPGLLTFGVAAEWQLVPAVPSEPHDRALTAILVLAP